MLYWQYEAVRRDEVVGIRLLALFLGGFCHSTFLSAPHRPGGTIPLIHRDKRYDYRLQHFRLDC